MSFFLVNISLRYRQSAIALSECFPEEEYYYCGMMSWHLIDGLL